MKVEKKFESNVSCTHPLQYGLFSSAISRATLDHSNSRFIGTFRFFIWSSSHCKSSYLGEVSVVISFSLEKEGAKEESYTKRR